METVRQVASSYLHGGPWWDWQIPVYLFLGGLAAGLMILTALRPALDPRSERSERFRALAWLPPVLLSLGMLALWLDLGRRWNVLRFYLAFRPGAPMSWGAWILLAVYPVSLLFALAELGPIRRDRLERAAGRSLLRRSLLRLSERASDPGRARRLAWAKVALGVALGIYTGVLLGAFSARPLWNSPLLGPLFLCSGLSTGAAVMLLAGLEPRERQALARIDAGLIAAELVLLGLFLGGLMKGGAVAQEAGRLLLGGAWTEAFWGVVVIGGLAVPLAAEIREARGEGSSRWFAPALVLIGGLALRWILVAAGQASSWAMR